MKIDRVVVCLNNNPTYTGFWNVVSKVWRVGFDIQPTLAFLGTQEEVDALGLKDTYGDIVLVPPCEDVIVDPTLEWSVSWALFWVMSKYSDDVCMSCGIDQIPICNDLFYRKLDTVPDDNLFIGLGNAYGHNRWYPTSHQVAKGKTFKEIYNIEDDWFDEVRKVYSKAGVLTNTKNLWGLEEAYAGTIITGLFEPFKYEDRVVINDYSAWLEWNGRRLTRNLGGSPVPLWTKEGVNNQQYTELHSPRPYEQYQTFIDELVEVILGVQADIFPTGYKNRDLNVK